MRTDLATTPAAERDLPGVVLTLAEAAWASGLARGELQAAIRAGRLPVRRVVRAGRVVSVVPLRDLERVHAAHAGAARQRRDETADLRERVAGLEGELRASERVERSLQRYADRLEDHSSARIRELEATLTESRKREMTLARALGRAEALLERGATADRARELD